MNTQSRHARMFVFYAFLLLLLIRVHSYIYYRINGNFTWTRWVPGEEPLGVIFVALYILAGLGFVIAGVRAWFALREDRGKASPLAREINREGILRTLERRWQFPHLTLAAKFALGCFCVLAFTVTLLASRTLDAAEWSVFPPGFAAAAAPDEQATIVMSLSTSDGNLGEYLSCVQHVALDLERAGARVILCAVPDTSAPGERSAMVAGIAQVKNVVLYDGRRPVPPERSAIPSGERNPGRMPLVTNVMNSDRPWGDVVQTWYPYATYSTRGFGTNEKEARMDAGVAAVGRYLGLADNVRPVRDGNALVYGGIVVPVTGSGRAYSRTLWCKNADLTAMGSLRADGSIAMRYHHYPDWEESDDIPPRYAMQFAGKIVLLDWLHEEPFGYSYERFYASVRGMQSNIENMLHQSMLVPLTWLTIALVIASLAVSLFAMLRLPIRWGVVLTIAFGLALFAGGVYALGHSHVVVRTGYALIAAIACATVLPYIRLLHERGEGSAMR